MTIDHLDERFFDLGLHFEDLTPEEVREAAEELRGQISPDRRASFFFAGMAALQQSPLRSLGDEGQRQKLKAWGEGLGITEAELLAGLDAMLSIALRREGDPQ